jgi:chromosome segregation ATPase
MKKTLKSMEDEITELKEMVNAVKEMLQREGDARRKAQAECTEAKTSLDESRVHFADLKTRLHTAEAANQKMRGYIARIQEDDRATAELMLVGDPNGEHTMVPKRKPTEFEPPSDFTTSTDGFDGMLRRQQRVKPKHWINY